jgi:hypothetical protein
MAILLHNEYAIDRMCQPPMDVTKTEIGDVGQQPQRRPGQVEQQKCAAPDSRSYVA